MGFMAVAGALSAAKKLKLGGLFDDKPAKHRRKAFKLAAKKLAKLAKYDPANAAHYSELADELKGASSRLREVNQYKYHAGPRPSWLAGTAQDTLAVPAHIAAPVRAQADRRAAELEYDPPAEKAPAGFDWGSWGKGALEGALGGVLEDTGIRPGYGGGAGYGGGDFGGEYASPGDTSSASSSSSAGFADAFKNPVVIGALALGLVALVFVGVRR